MITRREALGTVGLAALGSTAGCLDAVPFVGGDPIKLEASAAAVPQSTLDSTDYEEHQRRDLDMERTYEVGDRTQEVVVTNRQVEYDRAVDLGDLGLPVDQRARAAIFTVLSTPQVEVLGREFNPVAEMDSADLAEMVQERYEGMENLQQVGEETRTVADQSTTVGAFETDADLMGAGVTVDLTLHISESVELGDDLVLAIGGYPTSLRSQEASNVFSMMAGIEHAE